MKKFVKSSLVDQIFDYIQGEIIHGTWKPGEKLPSETELAASLEVSRMSLRSAIQRCCAMGLTETRTGEGTFVRNFNLRSYFSELYRMKLLGQQPNEINDLCAILQLGSARLAFASNVTPEKIQELEQLDQTMESAANANDQNAFHEADIQFHRAICGLGDNHLLFMIYDAVESLIDDTIQHNVELSVKHAGGYSLVLEHHRELLESIRANDMDRFTKAIMASRSRSIHYYPTLES